MKTTSVRGIKFGGNNNRHIKDKSNDTAVLCPYSACGDNEWADFLACDSMCAAFGIVDEVCTKAVCAVGKFTIGAFCLSKKQETLNES